MAIFAGSMATMNSRLDRVAARLDRIERRLELSARGATSISSPPAPQLNACIFPSGMIEHTMNTAARVCDVGEWTNQGKLKPKV